VSDRPSVSVIVPFLGTEAQLAALIERLAAIARRPGDELIVADNRPRGHATIAVRGAVRVCPAREVQSPGFARNHGAELAGGDWLVFVDADTRPSASLLDDYFDPPPASRTAVLAGGVRDVGDGGSLAARHSVARGHMSQAATMSRPAGPYAQTVNCAVRRSAFIELGGFEHRVRAGEDADLCLRLQASGWGLEQRSGARVEHRARDGLPALLVQLARHGSGARWLNRRYPGLFPPPTLRQLARRLASSLLAALAKLARGEPEAASFAALDVLAAIAFELGRLLPNRAPERN